MRELRVLLCRRCGATWFPDRLRCPGCGGRMWARVPAGEGLVEQRTELRRVPGPREGPIRLGSIRLDTGPVVIARVCDGVDAGSRVRLETDADGAIWTRSAPRAAPST